jgi:CHC2 zinc finger/Toprim domain
MSTSIDFATLKEAVALSTIVSETVQLKRDGRHWKAVCPFHAERTPSFYVYSDTQKFHCFGCGAHGDAFDWLVKQRGMSIQEAGEYLGGDQSTADKFISGDASEKLPKNYCAPLQAQRLPDPDTLRKLAQARHAWEKALPPHNTPVERYLETRGVRLPDADVLRWHPCCPRGTGTMPAMVARMSDPVTNEFRGLHRTFIRPDGSAKADIPKGEQKMMLGGSGIIQLADLHDIGVGLGLSEGIETALSVMQVLRWGPVWAAGSAGNITSFPFLPATTLNVFADADANGTGLKAAHDCRTRWAESGGEVFIHEPPAGKDWNDIAGGIRSW